jgi:hypothetical protein
MRLMMLTWLLLVLPLRTEQQSKPQIRVLALQHCDVATVIVLEIANDSTTDHVYLPLSPQYSLGHTVHNLRVEVQRNGTWQPLERGLDTHPAGIRDLEPGEKLIDEVGVPLSAANSLAQSQARLRIQMPYKAGLSQSYQDVFSTPFAYSPSAIASTPRYPCPK